MGAKAGIKMCRGWLPVFLIIISYLADNWVCGFDLHILAGRKVSTLP